VLECSCQFCFLPKYYCQELTYNQVKGIGVYVGMVNTNLILNIKLKLWVCVYVCSLTAREGINKFAPNLAYLCPETSGIFYEGQNFEKSVLGSKPGEGFFSVHWKLMTAEHR
jgi:hypothetical protein